MIHGVIRVIHKAEAHAHADEAFVDDFNSIVNRRITMPLIELSTAMTR